MTLIGLSKLSKDLVHLLKISGGQLYHFRKYSRHINFCKGVSRNALTINLSYLKTETILALSLLVLIASFTIWTTPASATINDDRYEGNVYVLFGGNGSLVPPRMDLPTSLKREKPAILVFCVDDSSDCKQFSIEVTRLQEFYGRAASIIPVSIDAFIDKAQYSPQEPAYYYSGVVPQTVILDQKGKVVYDGKGQVPYEEMDDVLRKVFDLLPRSESTVLKRRSFNEFNSGMTRD